MQDQLRFHKSDRKHQVEFQDKLIPCRDIHSSTTGAKKSNLVDTRMRFYADHDKLHDSGPVAIHNTQTAEASVNAKQWHSEQSIAGAEQRQS